MIRAQKTQTFDVAKELNDFKIVGYSQKYLATWKLYLDLKIGDKYKTIEIGDGNSKKPFKTSGKPESGFKEDLLWGGMFGFKFVPRN